MMLLPTDILRRVHLFEREKAERKAGLLEKTLAGTDGFTPYMNMKGQEDSLDSFMMTVRINFDWFLKKQNFYYLVLLQEILGKCWVVCRSAAYGGWEEAVRYGRLEAFLKYREKAQGGS